MLPSGVSLQPLSSAVDETTLVVWPSMQMTGVDGPELGSDMAVIEDNEEDDSYHWDGLSLFSSDESSEDKHDDIAELSDLLSVESFVSITSMVSAMPLVMEDPGSDSSSSTQSSHSQQHFQCQNTPFVHCSSHMTKGVPPLCYVP